MAKQRGARKPQPQVDEPVVVSKKKPEGNPLIPKTKNQKTFIRTIAENALTICIAPAGTGKAGSVDSIVYTPGGPIRMGDIKPGQLVSTPDGDYATVLAIYPQGKKEIFKVTFTDGSSTECCKEHLWFTKTVLDRNAKRDGTVKTLEKISNTLVRKGKRNHSIPMTSPVFFKEQTLPIEPYVLGLLLGDGYLGEAGQMIGFSTTDNEIENYLSVGLENNLATLKRKGRVDFYINGKEFKKELEHLGLRGLKSETKFIPDIYKINSVENRIAILQGLMDTDGTIGKDGDVSFTSVSKKLTEDVKFLIQSLGGTATITIRTPSYTYNGEVKSGKLAYTLHINLPNEIIPFRLERKISRIIPKTKYPPRRYIDKVESLGFKEAQCIYIDSDDHLYLTDEFIVTHNTHVSIGMACDYLMRGSQNGGVDRIVISKPLAQCGPGVGHLPGTIQAKADPFMGPILDALHHFLGEQKTKDFISKGMIQIVPLEVMRGTNLHNTFVILDEMQNCTYLQLKMFATRLGNDSKCVISGDLRQSDLDRYNFSNSDILQARFIDKLKGKPDIGYCELGIEDIVRSGIAKTIITSLD